MCVLIIHFINFVIRTYKHVEVDKNTDQQEHRKPITKLRWPNLNYNISAQTLSGKFARKKTHYLCRPKIAYFIVLSSKFIST